MCVPGCESTTGWLLLYSINSCSQREETTNKRQQTQTSKNRQQIGNTAQQKTHSQKHPKQPLNNTATTGAHQPITTMAPYSLKCGNSGTRETANFEHHSKLENLSLSYQPVAEPQIALMQVCAHCRRTTRRALPFTHAHALIPPDSPMRCCCQLHCVCACSPDIMLVRAFSGHGGVDTITTTAASRTVAVTPAAAVITAAAPACTALSSTTISAALTALSQAAAT